MDETIKLKTKKQYIKAFEYLNNYKNNTGRIYISENGVRIHFYNQYGNRKIMYGGINVKYLNKKYMETALIDILKYTRKFGQTDIETWKEIKEYIKGDK